MSNILTTQPSLLKVILIYLFIYKAYHLHVRGVLFKKKIIFTSTEYFLRYFLRNPKLFVHPVDKAELNQV